MKKVLARLAVAALLLGPLRLLGQAEPCADKDCDGDGIANESDPRPLVADLPYVDIAVSGLELRLAGKVYGTLPGQRNAELLKRALAWKLDAKLALAEKMTPVLRLGGEGSDEVVRTIETSEAVSRWNEARGAEPVLPAAPTGALRALVELRNPGAKAVVLKDLRYAVTLADPCDPAGRKTVREGTLGSGNLTDPGAGEPGASRPPGDGASAEIKVRAGSTLTKAVWLTGLPAQTVLDAVASRRQPRFEITDAVLSAGSRTIDREALRTSVLAKSIEVTIVDAAGSETVQYVSAVQPGGTSLRGALDLLEPGRVEVKGVQGQTVLSGLGEARSAFSTLADPRTFTREELPQGAWFTAALSAGSSGSLTDPAPAGTRFALVWLTKGDLLAAVKDVRRFVLRVDDPLHPVTVASIRTGDVVKIRFTGSRQPSETSTRSMADAFAVSSGFPLKDKRFWELIQATETLPTDTLVAIPPQASAAAYGLRLFLAPGTGAGREVSLDELPLLCPRAFQPNPDGSVELELAVPPGLLPGGQGALQLQATSTTETMKVGRAFGKGSGDDALALRNPEVLEQALRFAADWQHQMPLAKREIQRLRVFDVSVRVISAVPPRSLTLLTGGDRGKILTLCGDVAPAACLAASEALKSRCAIQDVACLRSIRCTGALGRQLQDLEQSCAMAGGSDPACRSAQAGLKTALDACQLP